MNRLPTMNLDEHRVWSAVAALTGSLRDDERGGVSWIGLILFTTIVAMGTIVGLSTYRSQVLQQFGDASVAIRNLRQEYRYQVQIDADGNGVFTDPGDCLLAGSFSDVVDLVDVAGDAPACMNLTAAPQNEN